VYRWRSTVASPLPHEPAHRHLPAHAHAFFARLANCGPRRREPANVPLRLHTAVYTLLFGIRRVVASSARRLPVNDEPQLLGSRLSSSFHAPRCCGVRVPRLFNPVARVSSRLETAVVFYRGCWALVSHGSVLRADCPPAPMAGFESIQDDIASAIKQVTALTR
jgi:hypothetical protein